MKKVTIYLATLETGRTVECSSYGDMLNKARKACCRVVSYEIVKKG